MTMADITNVETKELAELLGILGTAIYQAGEDGSYGADDFGKFIPALIKAPQAFQGVGKIPAEAALWKTRPELRIGVIAVFKANLTFSESAQVSEQAIETIVDCGIQLAVAFSQLFGKKETVEVA